MQDEAACQTAACHDSLETLNRDNFFYNDETMLDQFPLYNPFDNPEQVTERGPPARTSFLKNNNLASLGKLARTEKAKAEKARAEKTKVILNKTIANNSTQHTLMPVRDYYI
mmetsp:Transcript_41298/g.62888  ORF Transcript_41298/g.62888 Transcript_41298/m.62888 type:complete len:112 (-) Transcript_41298:159-494(-)